MHLVHIISSLERGGAQAVLFDVIAGLAKEGYEQSVIYFHEGPYKERFLAHGIPLYRIGGCIVPFDPVGIYQLYRLLKRLKPTCLHTVLWAAHWMTRLIAKFLHIPCISSLHNNYEQNGTFRLALDTIMPFWNEAIIAVSSEVKESFCLFHRVKCPIIVIRNGINRERLQKVFVPLSRATVHFLPEHFIIGSVGRFTPIKRYPLLLETFAYLYKRYPHIRLLLVGTGPEEMKLKQLAERLGIAEGIAWIIDTPAYPYYRMMDCFMLTSPKEGISIALLEAMSLRVACVVTGTSLQHPVLEHMRNGIVAITDNPIDLAQHVAMLINDTAMRQTIAACAQKTIQRNFDSKQMIASYNKIFQLYTKQD